MEGLRAKALVLHEVKNNGEVDICGGYAGENGCARHGPVSVSSVREWPNAKRKL